MKDLIIGLDFDGTCVMHVFPEIGEELPNCIATLKRMKAAGAKIVLHTMRSDMPDRNYLSEAVSWLHARGIELYGINHNPEQSSWTGSPKAYAHLYIDDAALGAPLKHPDGARPHIDWFAVEQMLFEKPILKEKIILS